MSNQPVAIVGIATELPSGEHSPKNFSHEEFFEFLLAGKDSYERIPGERFNIESWAGRGLGQSIAERGSFVKDVGLFDPTEFGIAAKDARAMAVSARRLVELSFLALLDSGIDYRGQNVGCYASATAFDMQSIAEPDEMEPKGSLAGIPCMVANKISYHLDLRGPSIPIDTACSSSAVALHMAVQAINAGECDAAVVAGCQLNLRASDFALYTQASILAPDGKCKPFDAGGNGFSRGEGAVVAVIKSLDQALKDGDYIYGTILGTGVSSSGSIAPVNAPVAEMQANAADRAWSNSGRRPAEVDFVEVHGTGTKAGDPTEANWVGKKFSDGRASELLITSVKGNIGHLEITSFLASLSKVLSIFRTGEVPPQANLKNLNQAIHWEEFNMRVPRSKETISARHPSGKMLTAICSSGIGGVNAHAVIESHPAPNTVQPAVDGPVLLLAAGLSPRSTSAIADDIKSVVAETPYRVADFSVIYGRRARQMTWRSFAVRKPGQATFDFSAPVLGPRVKPPVVFLFSGQGPQHINMGRQLFQAYPVFRQSILELDEVFKARTGTSMIHDIGLFGSSSGKPLPSVWPISLILPSITAVQCALFDLLCSFGLRPDVLIGHSAGETSLLYASGAGSKEMALEISIARGIAMTIVEERSEGTMAAVACSADDANRIIQSVAHKHPDKRVEIACYNSPEAVALAGSEVLIDEAIALATKAGFMGRKIMTRVPVHCSLMDMCKDEFTTLVGKVFERYPGAHLTKVATYSTCTGELLDRFTADYFWNNSRGAVHFTRTTDALTRKFKNPVVVEMSPHPVLASYVTELGVMSSNIVAPMRRSKNITQYMEQSTLLTSLGQLAAAGCDRIDFNLLNGRAPTAAAPRAILPEYPFAKKAVEYFPEVSRVIYRQMNSKLGPVNFPDLRMNVATHPELADHLINSEPIMPAAGFIEMGLEFGAKTLWNVKFHSILALSGTTPTSVEVAVEGQRYTVSSKGSGSKYFNHDSKALRLHADGFFSFDSAPAPQNLDLGKIKSRCTPWETGSFYETLKYFAQYGPSFRRVDELYVGEKEALVRIKGAGTDLARDGKYIIHPAILDASFHACVHPSMTKSTDPNVYFLPAGVNAINLFPAMTPEAMAAEHVFAHLTFRSWHPKEVVYDVALLSESGEHLCKLHAFTVARHHQVPVENVSSRFELVYQPYGLISRKNISSRASDSGISVSDDEETLVDQSRDLLRHVVDSCGKKAVRVLELGGGGDSPIVGKDILPVLEAVGAVFPTYTIAAKNPKVLPKDSLPPQHTIVEVDITSADLSAKLEAASFDMVIGIGFLGDESVCQAVRKLLVPGGFLLFSGSAAHDWSGILEACAFENINVAGDSKTSAPAIIHGQAPTLPAALPEVRDLTDALTIVPYVVGNEMAAQQILEAIDDAFEQPIWIVASEGIDGHGLEGFGRTLTKEFPQWNIRLATFASVYTDSDRAFIISKYLPQTGTEREFVVDTDMDIFVPRIMPSAAPSRAAFSASSPALAKDEVLVEVAHCARSDTGLWGVVGKVVASSSESEGCQPGTEVVAVSVDAPAKMARIHHSSVAPLMAGASLPAVATVAPAIFFAGVALGSTAFSNPARLKSQILVTHADAGTGKAVAAILESCGLSVSTLDSSFTPQDLYALRLAENSVILTASDTTDQLLGSYVPQHASIVSWSDLSRTKSVISRDPWLVSDVLSALIKLPSLGSAFAAVDAKAEAVAPLEATPSQLFRADKSYLLVGGTGSLGPYIAQWMYEKGARHIVLTSRSGRKSLEKLGDSLPGRVFHYVESLPEVKLTVAAADATDVGAMGKLINGLEAPLGGAIFLAAIFDDRFFFAQDQDSFKRSFAGKVGSMTTLESIVDVNKLDFIISLSSGTIWGNSGQTNYTSANTALDGKLKPYRNAFSIAAPAILDTTSMSGTVASSDAQRAGHLSTWMCSPTQLCDWLEDGLLKLADAPIHVYVPAVDFNVLTESLGPSHLYAHMTTKDDSPNAAAEGQDIGEALQSLILQFVDVAADDFSTEVPLTTYGLDSLSAGRLSFALRPWITLSQMSLLADMSTADLITRVEKAQGAKKDAAATTDASGKDVGESVAEIEKMIGKYTLGLDGGKRFSGPLLPEAVVLLTGTTGGLGSYFLSQLLQDAAVNRVYAFNRPSSSGTSLERQMSAFADRGLDVALLASPKLVFVEGDAAESGLGLPKDKFEELKAAVTVIVHNAWRLDLNAPIKTFTPNIAGTRNLVDLALASPNRESIRFGFISSIASTQGWKDLHKAVPEEMSSDVSTAVLRGYGEGKYVAERIVTASGLQSSVFRVGQLTGASDSGAWALSEWIPMVVKTSMTINALPDAGGLVSWLAMDKVSPIVLDAVLSPEAPSEVYNVVHPRPTSWHALFEAIGTGLSATITASHQLPLVPFKDWLTTLETAGKTATTEEAQRLPALKLLDRLRIFADGCPPLVADGAVSEQREAGGWPTLALEKILARSKTMAAMLDEREVIGAEHAKAWLAFWQQQGMFVE